MGFIKSMFNRLMNRSPTKVRYELVSDKGNGFYSFDGKLYKSDIIRSCIRPYSKAVGKMNAKHIRENKDVIKVNPDTYIKMLMAEPNPYMTGQMFREKMANMLALNNNAFAYINRDDNGYAMEIYPVPAISVEAIYDDQYRLFLKFVTQNGRQMTFPYDDVIHLRNDFYSNDIFGEPNNDVLIPLMEVVVITDQSIIKAIKNSSIVKWLLEFNSSLRPEDMKRQAKAFTDNYLHVSDDDETVGVGVVATDTKANAKQVDPKDYVPNAAIMDRTKSRLYEFFNTNEKIVQSKYNEDEWNAYYESVLEPVSKQLSEEFTRKLFSLRERGHGNKIIFEASSLQYASMATKLNLVQFVDRGMMTPNEVRNILNMGPIDGGDMVLLRKDTGVVGGENNGQSN